MLQADRVSFVYRRLSGFYRNINAAPYPITPAAIELTTVTIIATSLCPFKDFSASSNEVLAVSSATCEPINSLLAVDKLLLSIRNSLPSAIDCLSSVVNMVDSS